MRPVFVLILMSVSYQFPFEDCTDALVVNGFSVAFEYALAYMNFPLRPQGDRAYYSIL